MRGQSGGAARASLGRGALVERASPIRRGASREPGRGLVRALAILLALAGAASGGGLAAQELEELRPGMDEFAAASVYTRHRSCSNVPFVDEPGRMAWSAPILGRPAEVELRFEGGRAVLVRFGLPLLPGEDPGVALGELARALEGIWGPPAAAPAAAPGGGAGFRWLAPGLSVELEAAPGAGISIAYRAPR